MLKQLATPRHAAADSTPPSSGRLSHPDDVRTIISQQRRLQEQFEALQQQQQQQQPQQQVSTTANTGDEANTISSSSDVAPVAFAIKLPPYRASDPQIWFAQIESVFTTRRISKESTRFHHVIASLSPEYAAEVRDLILAPPVENPYSTLKSRLIQRTQISEQKRVRLLLSEEELGDSQPTQFLRRLQRLMGEHHMDDKLFRELFVSRLPTTAQQVLAACQESLPIDELAVMADRILTVATPATVHAVQPYATKLEDSISALQAQVTALTTAVEQLKHQQPHRGRSYSRSRQGSRSGSAHPSSPSPGATASELCFYHTRYGDQARRCRQPCTWSGNAPARQ